METEDKIQRRIGFLESQLVPTALVRRTKQLHQEDDMRDEPRISPNERRGQIYSAVGAEVARIGAYVFLGYAVYSNL